MRISLPLPQPVHIASTHARSRSRQATPAQADAATPGPARGSHAARAEAPADEATPGPSRLQRRALLAVPLGSLLAPRALASGSPYDDVLPPVGVLNGRLQPCPSTFNCASTSSRSSDQYTAPWVAAPELKSAKAAADEIVEAVRVLFPQAELVTSEALPSGQYVRFHVAGRFSLPDEVEFLVRNEGVNGRNFSGDEGSGLLVTLRSVAGTVQFVYPFVTPISDGGLQKSRLALIRDQLRWRLVGCELQECYAQ